MRQAIMLVTAMMCAVILTTAVGVANAGGKGAAKEVVLNNAFGDCDVGATVGSPTDSFAIINFPANGTVAATIKLNGMDPNTTYQVRLVQTPNGLSGNCGAIDATLTTDSEGNGTLHLSEPRDSTTTGAFVLLEGGLQGFLATDGVLDA
jgi:hypothetical protein